MAMILKGNPDSFELARPLSITLQADPVTPTYLEIGIISFLQDLSSFSECRRQESPTIFFIRHKPSNSILFLGRFAGP